jgi:hypothetical protein
MLSGVGCTARNKILRGAPKTARTSGRRCRCCQAAISSQEIDVHQ